MVPNDFELLFTAAPHSDLVLTPELRIAAVTDAYLEATMTQREQILGRDLFDVFPDNPDDPTATGVTNLRASLERVLATKAADRMPLQKYDVRRPASEGGEFAERYWCPLNSPILGPEGEVRFIVHHVEDVTDEVRQEANLLDARVANERLRQFVENAPASLAMLDREFRYLHVSDRWRADYGLGDEDIIGRSHYDVFPRVPQAWRDVHQRALAGEVVRAPKEGERFMRADGSEHWIDWEVRPWRDTHGIVQGIVIFAEDLTERKQLEARLREREREAAVRERSEQSEQQYRDLMEAAPDAMLVVDRKGRIQMVNAQAQKLFGYTREELVGSSLSRLVPKPSREAHDAHVEEFFAHPTARTMASGLELAACRKDGSSVPVEVSLGPVRTPHGLGVCAAVRDISERRRLADAANRTARRLTSAVESMDDPFVLFDDTERVVLCNAAYRRLLGVRDDLDLGGKTMEDMLALFAKQLFFPDEAARERFLAGRRDAFAAVRRGGRPAIPSEVQMRDGRRIRFITQGTFEGGVVVTVWDLTAEEKRNAELRRAHAAAAAGSAAKTEFLGSMSHELRTPLNAVLGFAQLLERDKKEPLTERQRERVQRILSGGEQLLRLVDDVLDLARIEAGRVAISVEPVAVADVLAEVKRTLEPMEASVGIEIAIESPGASIPLVSVDRMRYAQILANFCSNALKYNRPHGTVRITTRFVAPERVRVTVTDTGCGIPLAKQALLFQPFQRAGQETGPIEGTGIGLVITRNLATLMNGAVGFVSVEGQGSSFWVEVPASETSKLPVVPTTRTRASDEDVLESTGRRRRLLYVEDNPANVAFVREVAGDLESIDIVTTPTAEMGIELAIRNPPDVILMDVNLAGEMDGFDAVRVLRQSAVRRVPIIGLSAAATSRDRAEAQAAGFDRYLTKPVDLNELRSVLESYLPPG